ncbi:MAG: hypothetical protein WC346_07840 [Methanogenium sp.]|jgi:hypothetical protein
MKNTTIVRLYSEKVIELPVFTCFYKDDVLSVSYDERISYDSHAWNDIKTTEISKKFNKHTCGKFIRIVMTREKSTLEILKKLPKKYITNGKNENN